MRDLFEDMLDDPIHGCANDVIKEMKDQLRELIEEHNSTSFFDDLKRDAERLRKDTLKTLDEAMRKEAATVYEELTQRLKKIEGRVYIK
tara:strand:- start:283 stop:549 length:267 start_codon:yes stop_codon:yes gene_type:complete